MPTLLEILQDESASHRKGGLYHRIQIDFAYNSNHIEGSRLTHEETRYIFETNTVGQDGPVNVDDVIETANHFRCVDLILERARHPLRERLIKELHRILKSGTMDSRKAWFSVGDYKTLPNTVGGRDTTPPADVPRAIQNLLRQYRDIARPTLFDLLDFHVRFERIHPFQDGNGRVGRLLLFKECLRAGETPFLITDDLKYFYYRGIGEWDRERGYLLDACRTAQDRFEKLLAQYLPAELSRHGNVQKR